jgi:hypothetical protein
LNNDGDAKEGVNIKRAKRDKGDDAAKEDGNRKCTAGAAKEVASPKQNNAVGNDCDEAPVSTRLP